MVPIINVDQLNSCLSVASKMGHGGIPDLIGTTRKCGNVVWDLESDQELGGARQAWHKSGELKAWLVVWNIFYFPIYWEFHHPN